MKRYIEISNDDIKRILAGLFQQDIDSVQSELVQLPKKYAREKARFEPLYKIYCGKPIE